MQLLFNLIDANFNDVRILYMYIHSCSVEGCICRYFVIIQVIKLTHRCMLSNIYDSAGFLCWYL